ncbi:MAG: PTS sugar transporter subunit IIB [Erysipelotrichales bacterium]|nr:PTS sugar transporter subunit IIB [Erysipelotrichales bacterium]
MKKVYLFCSNGMSTSLLAQKMQDVADAHNLPFEVKAFPIGTLGEIVIAQDPDCILLGPQVKYLYQDTVDKYGANGKPIFVIDSADYGMMDGEKVLKKAIMAMKKAKK